MISIKGFLTTAFLAATTMATNAMEGWISRDASGSVSETANKLVAAAEGAGAKVFAVIDHAAGAESIGSELPGATLVIFGNPKIGTPIMKSNLAAGLDLPIRVLIWDDGGKTKIGYLDPQVLKERYNIEGADEALKMMGSALGKLTGKAAE